MTQLGHQAFFRQTSRHLRKAEIAVIAAAATPVLLLHSGADKNDLMTCFFAIAALLWGARWYVHGGAMPWILTIVSLVLAGGTKPHAAAILLGLAPFMITLLMPMSAPSPMVQPCSMTLWPMLTRRSRARG